MISSIIEWFKDWWNLPGEIRRINKKTQGISKANIIAFLVMLVCCAICLYLGLWISGSILFVASFVALIWNSDIASVLLKMLGYALGASTIGCAVAGLLTLIFSLNFMAVMAGVSAMLFFVAIIFLGTD